MPRAKASKTSTTPKTPAKTKTTRTKATTTAKPKTTRTKATTTEKPKTTRAKNAAVANPKATEATNAKPRYVPSKKVTTRLNPEKLLKEQAGGESKPLRALCAGADRQKWAFVRFEHYGDDLAALLVPWSDAQKGAPVKLYRVAMLSDLAYFDESDPMS